MQCCSRAQRKDADSGPTFPLAMASEGEKVKIVLFRGGGSLRERLLSMGICLEDEIVIVQKHDGGAVLIAREGNRLAFACVILIMKSISRAASQGDLRPLGARLASGLPGER